MSRSFLCLLNTIFAMATYVSVRKELDHQEALVEADVFYARAKVLASRLDMAYSNIETGKLSGLLRSMLHIDAPDKWFKMALDMGNGPVIGEKTD